MIIDYQYFVNVYKPSLNQFNSKALYNGMLYNELEFSRIAPIALPNRLLWTIFKEERIDPQTRTPQLITIIRPGLISSSLRIGYFVCAEPYEYGQNIEVHNPRELDNYNPDNETDCIVCNDVI